MSRMKSQVFGDMILIQISFKGKTKNLSKDHLLLLQISLYENLLNRYQKVIKSKKYRMKLESYKMRGS